MCFQFILAVLLERHSPFSSAEGFILGVSYIIPALVKISILGMQRVKTHTQKSKKKKKKKKDMQCSSY